MSAESPRHARSGGGPLTVPSQPPSDRSIIDAVSGFINDVTLSASSAQDPKDVIQWARFENADINEPTSEGDSENDISPLLLILGYGSGVQVWLVPPSGEAQEVLSWRQGTVRVLRILPTPQHGDCYLSKRPLIALCDSASPGPSFCCLSFISIRGGEQVKSIKFKNPILDVLANKRSVVVSFSERFAVFDAATLEDRMAITTCYPCPCPLGGSAPINPLALGDRWLAYADKKLNQSKRSSGGCEGEGQTSYTATVLHAAKSLSKGLRGLGETVAHSLAGGRTTSQSPSPPNADAPQPGVVTILDIEGNDEEDGQDNEEVYDPIIAHFIAHTEAIIAVKFDASGMLLVTADRRGHDFHVFRINPHPCGPGLASVHHLYVLHRGDTTAKVQDIALSPDSRWVAISTLRGTTHMFALSPYGGACGVRTHTAPRVVNRLSRFHRSAGLPIHAHHHHTGSPVSDGSGAGAWFPNPRLPPYPSPTVNTPLAQLRPTANLPTHTITRTSSGRQRLSSLSEDSNTAPLLARARFGPSGGGAAAAAGSGPAAPATALYLMSASGCLSHIALHVRAARNVPKEKICDESPIELEVEPIAQWPLQRPAVAADLLAPLPPSNPLLQPLTCRRCLDMCMSEEERWLSQVEIVTHAGPHRRLWMGPQFVFKTYNCTGSNSSLSEAETVEVDTSVSGGVARSTPVNMPAARPIVPVLIDSGSASSLEHSPSDSFRRKSLLADSGRAASVCDVQLKEDLAEAMKEDHGWRSERTTPACRSPAVARAVGPGGAVVQRRPGEPLQALDPDAHTTCNQDEATFRPVVRAPAALPLRPDMLVRPLPRTTTIPVQTVAGEALASPAEPLPLTTHVVIPAALTAVAPGHASGGLLEAESPTVGESVLACIRDLAAASETAEPDRAEEKLDEKDAVSSVDRPLKTTVASVEPVSAALSEKPASQKRREKSVERREAPVRRDRSSRRRDSPAKVDKTEVKVDKSEVKVDKIEVKVDKSEVKVDKAEIKIDKVEVKIDKTEVKIATKADKHRKKPDEARVAEREPRTTEVASKVDSVNVDVKRPDVNKDLKRQEIDGRKRDSARDRSSAECAEREREDSKPLPKSNRPPDDIQPVASVRVKKSPTPKSVSDRDSEVSYKDYKSKNPDEPLGSVEPKEKETKEEKDTKEVIEPKEIKKQKDVRDSRNSKDRDGKSITKEDKRFDEFKTNLLESKLDKIGQILTVDETPALKISTKKEIPEIKPKKREDDDIKTEEQAWDMLLNEPEKQITYNISQSTEDKPKSKKGRKIKKTQDDQQTKSTDDDSFVEIHAIEEKQQACDLISISTPLEDIDSTNSYLSKTKRQRASKTPDKHDEVRSFDAILRDETELVSFKPKTCKKYDEKSDIEVLPSPVHVQKEINKDSNTSTKAKKHSDGTVSEISFFGKEPPKASKSKSLSPYPEPRTPKPVELEKDVYVIDTAGEEFPEIQITRGTKPRKRSPQPIERKSLEKEPVIEKPIKSWSSIAAAKSVKKFDDFEKKEVEDKKKIEKRECDENQTSSKSVSLQEKLFELCKRTDIMVAECDAPTELNFVEEHHADLDLPPLEPLDFGLDDFKLEVMRDSLLDVNDVNITSPICKINIDDILSSIKETTSKAIESSAFNLIDLKKLPTKKEKGFSVIEGHKITSQEVKLDDDGKEEKEGDMEKSSEDDTSPVISTDSDKEDKKTAGASNLVLPSSKQSAKSKKSRRKKK